jgi:hypothetical protein
VTSALPPAPPDRVFTFGKDITFKAGAGVPKQRWIVDDTRFGGASPDLGVIVAASGQQGMLITPKAPKGLKFPAHSPHEDGDAVFSPDRTRVAILQYLGSLVVLDAATAKLQWEHHDDLGAFRECGVRFASKDELVFHGEGKDGDARLVRVDLTTGKGTLLGTGLDVDECTATPDGSRWLLFNDYEKPAGNPKGKSTSVGVVRVRDGVTGATFELVRGLHSAHVLSPTGDRVCWHEEETDHVSCLRASDRGLEKIWQGDASGLQIDAEGKRMLVTGTVQVKADYVPVMLVVDFATGTIRALDGPRLKSGGSVSLMSSGVLVASGSSSGIEIFDVDAGARWFAARSPFYSAYAIAGQPRRLIGGSEPPGGGSLEDLYLIDVP